MFLYEKSQGLTGGLILFNLKYFFNVSVIWHSQHVDTFIDRSLKTLGECGFVPIGNVATFGWHYVLNLLKVILLLHRSQNV